MKEGPGGSQCKECQGAVVPNGSHTRRWRPTPNILTSQSAFCQLQSMTWHNFHYPSALIGDGAGVQWQRKLVIASAHFEILLKNHTLINWESMDFVLSPVRSSAFSGLVKKEISICFTGEKKSDFVNDTKRNEFIHAVVFEGREHALKLPY